MFMVPYILVIYIYIYIYSIASPTRCTQIFYIFFITRYLFYMFRVLFAPIVRSTNCRVPPYVRVIKLQAGRTHVCRKVKDEEKA
jgi:hypothetical protein